MSEIYNLITGLSTHAYIVAGLILIVSLPAKILFKAIKGRDFL